MYDTAKKPKYQLHSRTSCKQSQIFKEEGSNMLKAFKNKGKIKMVGLIASIFNPQKCRK